MSEPTSPYMEDEPQSYTDGAVWAGEPIPVTVHSSRVAPDYGACMTWVIPAAGVGQPVQILTRRLRRHKAKLLLVSLTGATSVVFNAVIDRVQGITPQGFTMIAAGPMPEWESQQPLYAIAVGGTALVSLWDESYSER